MPFMLNDEPQGAYPRRFTLDMLIRMLSGAQMPNRPQTVDEQIRAIAALYARPQQQVMAAPMRPTPVFTPGIRG